MEIKVGFEISFAAAQPTPMVIMLSIHPSRHPDIAGRESIVAEPGVPISFYRDSFGNICGRLVAPRGGVTLRGNALVHDSGLPDPVSPAARQLPIDQLPDELLLYLMPSRLLRDRQAHRHRLVAVWQDRAGMGARAGHQRLRARKRHLRL